MKIRIELDLETETGKWEMRFNNLSKPGNPIDYREIKPFLDLIFDKADQNILNGIDSDEQVFREIH